MGWGYPPSFRDPESIRSFPAWAFIIVAGGVPLLCVIIGIYILHRDYVRRTTWSEERAMVTRSYVDGDWKRNRGQRYWAVIKYQYAIGDSAYRGEFTTPETESKGAAESAEEGYPEGKMVRIRVNPKDVSKSAHIGTEADRRFAYLLTAMMAGFFLLNVGIGVYGLYKQRELVKIERKSSQG